MVQTFYRLEARGLVVAGRWGWRGYGNCLLEDEKTKAPSWMNPGSGEDSEVLGSTRSAVSFQCSGTLRTMVTVPRPLPSDGESPDLVSATPLHLRSRRGEPGCTLDLKLASRLEQQYPIPLFTSKHPGISGSEASILVQSQRNHTEAQ